MTDRSRARRPCIKSTGTVTDKREASPEIMWIHPAIRVSYQESDTKGLWQSSINGTMVVCPLTQGGLL